MTILIKLSKIKIIISIIILLLIISGLIIIFKNFNSTNNHISVLNEYFKVQLNEAVDTIFKIRNKATLNNNPEILEELYNIDIRTGLWAYVQEENNINYLNSWAKKRGIKFQDIKSDIIIDNVNRNNGGFSLNLLISSKYYYTYKNQESPKTNSFKLGTHHYMDIMPSNEKLMITKEWYTNPFTYASAKNSANDKFWKIISSNNSQNNNHINETRKKAVDYADKFTGAANLKNEHLYNPEYKNYRFLGGDCANYASQIMYEGAGFNKTSIWNYRQNSGTRAWLNAQAFYNYMVNSGRGSLISRGKYEEILEDSFKLMPGDFIAYEKNGEIVHISVVTGKDSQGYTLVNSHDTDRYRSPWDLGWNNDGVKFRLVKMNY